MKVLALNCTLKASGPSSTDRMLSLILDEFAANGATHEVIRIAALDVKSGVTSDEGNGDEWPTVRSKIIEADILLMGTPIWMGQPGSISKRVCERLDAFFGEVDDKNRTPAYGKVATVAVVGNEDGAHHVSAELFQDLADVGFTISPGGPAYWVGEAMGKVDFKDLEAVPEKVTSTTKMLVQNSLHLARLLSGSPFPAINRNYDNLFRDVLENNTLGFRRAGGVG